MTSHAEWSQTTGATEVASAFTHSIRDTTIVLTGVSPKSIGAAAAVAIASQGPKLLILASRTKENIDAVIRDIGKQYSNVTCKPVVVDFSSLTSVRVAAGRVAYLAGSRGIDVIINNAGISVPVHQVTPDGFELHWASNHLGPFLFTKELLPALRTAAQHADKPGTTRVINVTSDGHVLSPIRFSDPNFTKPIDALPADERPNVGRIKQILPKPGETYSGFLAYGQSKCANMLTALHIGQEFEDRSIVGLSVHPGSIWTGLIRHLDERGTKMTAASSSFWKTLDQGAATTLVAAFDPQLGGKYFPGSYLSDCQLATPASHASRPETAKRLWRLSEQQVMHKKRSVL